MARNWAPGWQRFVMNLWPPFLCAGIRVEYIAPDWRAATVALRPCGVNRSASGTHFGGSLYAMTDPFFALMVRHNLPPGYAVWDQAASIDFVAPGRGRVWARFELTTRDLEHILAMTAEGDKHLHLFKVDVLDGEALVVARVEKIVYVRRRTGAP
jgi:acyl-coenzyme A thioesterase PaaI-like protein